MEVYTARRPRWAPLLFLVVCAPVVVDLLFGAFTITFLVPLIPTVFMYGLAALLIRGAARRQGAGWSAVIVLGAAFVVVSECLIVQTSLAPDPSSAWGRALGVNWTYLIWALGYINLWAIALSIQLTELVFPAHRDRPWLSPRGMRVVAVVFVVAAVPTWYNWTRNAAPQVTHQPVYDPPALTLVAAALVAVCLVIVGYGFARRPLRAPMLAVRDAPAPTGVALAAFLATVSWFALLIPSVTANAATRVPPTAAIGLALAVAAAMALTVGRWSRSRQWDDRHRLALITGALLASMAAGFPANHFSTVDLFGKIVLNAAALFGLLLLYRRVASSARASV